MEATTTEFEALRVLLEANAQRPPNDALRDGEQLRLVIDFVNAPTLAGVVRLLARDLLPKLKFDPNAEQLEARYGEHMTPARAKALADQAVAEEAKAEIDQTRADLRAIVDGSLSPQAVARLTSSASRQALLPVFDFDNGALRLRFRHCAENLAARLDYGVVTVLLNPDLQRDLCRCKRAGCPLFFLADRTTGGRPRTEFCTKRHMQEQHESDGVRRAEESRKRRARPKPKRARHK